MCKAAVGEYGWESAVTSSVSLHAPGGELGLARYGFLLLVTDRNSHPTFQRAESFKVLVSFETQIGSILNKNIGLEISVICAKKCIYTKGERLKNANWVLFVCFETGSLIPHTGLKFI